MTGYKLDLDHVDSKVRASSQDDAATWIALAPNAMLALTSRIRHLEAQVRTFARWPGLREDERVALVRFADEGVVVP